MLSFAVQSLSRVSARLRDVLRCYWRKFVGGGVLAPFLLMDVAIAQIILYEDDFEGVVSGWSDNRTDYAPAFSTFLGRFGEFNQETSRTFSVPASTDRVEIEFDFIRLDSWDDSDDFGNDRFEVEVDGVQIFSLRYFVVEDSERSGSTGNVSWSHTTIVRPGHYAFGCCEEWQLDRVDRFTIIVHAPGRDVNLLLRANTNQHLDDESGGYDNFRVSAFLEPAISMDKVATVPFDAPAGPFAVPGNFIDYTLSLTSEGGALDDGSVILIDNIPPELEVYTGDYDGSGQPVVFEDASSPPSGLVCCDAGNVAYSNSDSVSAPFDYTPTGPFDPAIRRVRITPSGGLRDASAQPANIGFRFRARIR
jgi:hypothetical protein